MIKPFPQSYWVVDGKFCAGQYPGSLNPLERDEKLSGLVACSIRCVISLMEENESSHDGRPFASYEPRMLEIVAEAGSSIELLRYSIPDAHAPTADQVGEILNTIDLRLEDGTPIYLHCWGGHGRTGTIVACYLMQLGASAQEAIDKVVQWREPLPKNHFPFEDIQIEFIRQWRSEK